MVQRRLARSPARAQSRVHARATQIEDVADLTGLMAAFDAPDGVLTCARRNESTTAPQALALLNSRFMVEQSDAAAKHLESASDAFRRILGRDPSTAELAAADEFLARQTERLGTRRAAMAELARGFMNLNEFLYVD